MKYIDYNDENIPLGKRKQSYVKCLLLKGTSLLEARKQANRKFGFIQKPGLLAIVRDNGRMQQNSFTGSPEIFQGYDLRKYKNHKWIDSSNSELELVISRYKGLGWDIVKVNLVS